jgi:hypothetical protein
MQLADIEPGLHVIWDDSPSIETRNNLIQKIDAFNHRTFPSKFERFALLLQDDAACLKGGVSGMNVSGVATTCCGSRPDCDRRRRWRHCRLRLGSRMLRTSVR